MADVIDPMKTAEFCDGYQAWRTRGFCDYKEPEQRRLWAEGFMFAYGEAKEGKSWYRSKTIWAGAVLIVVGFLLWRFGGMGDGLMSAGAGVGLTVGGALMEGLRLITREPLSMGGEP